MDYIKWDNKLSVNVSLIDEQKKQLFQYINRLIDLKDSKTEQEEQLFIDALLELIEGYKLYFKNEERFLSKYEYPEFEDHKKEHKKILRKLMIFRRWYAEDSLNFTDEMFEHIKDWMVKHTITHDIRYGPYIRLHTYLEENIPQKKRKK